MFPRTPLILRAVAALLVGVPDLLGGCGRPPQLPASPPPYLDPPSGSGVVPSAPATAGDVLPPAGDVLPPAGPFPGGMPPTVVLPPGPMPTYRTYPAATNAPRATTPAAAPRCTGEPTGAQILALIHGRPGIPNEPLQVDRGPYCSGPWSFATVLIAGKDASLQDPLAVVGYGAGSSLGLVAAGSDVCNDPVRQSAPPGIRVLACGF